MLRTFGSAPFDITHETGGTMCYRQCLLRLVISLTRQGVRLCSARCDIKHETGGTTCYGHWVLHLAISQTRQGYDLLCALGSSSSDTTHEAGGMICYGHLVLRLVKISHVRQTVTICYGHWVLHLVISHTKQGVRLVTGIGFFIL